MGSPSDDRQTTKEMTTPVYERMRNPIAPPKAKPLNLPRIRVKKWRERADQAEDELTRHWHTLSARQENQAREHIAYLREWITYAEAILNDGADPAVPFRSNRRAASYLGETCDPHHVHPVIKMEDFV